MPVDDVTWPRCPLPQPDQGPADVGECPRGGQRDWCEHTRDFLIKGLDSVEIEFGQRYCVPIVPIHDFYAEVSIDSEVIGGVCAKLALVFGTDPFSLNEDLIHLGMWTQGEGRLVIASIIGDWITANSFNECKASSHSFQQEMALQSQQNAVLKNGEWAKANRWCLAYYKMCLPCYDTNKAKASSFVDFDASSFGLDDTVHDRGFNNNSARAQDTMSRLKERFGRRP